MHVLALSDAGRGFGPEVSEATIREAFGDGWVLEALDEATYRGVVQESHSRGHRPAGRHRGRRAGLARAGAPPLSDFVCVISALSASYAHTNRYGIGIAGVGDVEPAAHQRAQARSARRRRGRRGRRRGWRRRARLRRCSRGRPARRRLRRSSSSSSSRSTMRSTLAATRAWKLTCPVGEPTIGPGGAAHVVVEKIGDRRDSSAAVGRPYSPLTSDRLPSADPARPIRFRRRGGRSRPARPTESGPTGAVRPGSGR